MNKKIKKPTNLLEEIELKKEFLELFAEVFTPQSFFAPVRKADTRTPEERYNDLLTAPLPEGWEWTTDNEGKRMLKHISWNEPTE